MELLIVIIVLALLFDFINGFHDAANSIATIVSTKVLTPFQAVLWAAFFNFVAFFIAKYIIGGFGIANTVSKTVVEEFITLPIILSGVIAAIAWNLITWWKGIPSSSSHTLIGGFAGAAIMASGFGAIQLNIILKIAAFIFLAPFIGMVVAFGFTILVLHICRRVQPHKAEVWFKKLQLAWFERFPKGNGYYCRRYDCRSLDGFRYGYKQHCRFARLGCVCLLYGHIVGDDVGRLEDSKNNGNENYEGYSVGGCGSRNGRGVHALFNRNFKDSRKYYTYHYRGYYRCGSDQTLVCGSLGCDEKSFSRMDSYDSCQCAFGSRYLYGRYFLFRISSLLLKNDIIYKFERKIAK